MHPPQISSKWVWAFKYISRDVITERWEQAYSSQDSSALWVQGTSVAGKFLDFSIPVTEHYLGLKTGCGCSYCLILQLKHNTGWSQSIILITGALFNILLKCSESFPQSPGSDRLQTSQTFLQTLQHTVCNPGKHTFLQNI